jgi:tight adherence protein B
VTPIALRALSGLLVATLLWARARRTITRERAVALRREHTGIPAIAGGLAAPRRIDSMLVRAGVDQPLAVVVRTWLLVVAACGAVGAGLEPAFGALAAMLALAGGPIALVLARHRAERRAAAAMPAMLRLIASELRVGGTVMTALDTVGGSPNPLARDMARVRARVELGAPLDDALEVWTRERPVAGVRAAAGALTLARRVGGPAADAIDGLAASVGDRIAATAETRAQSAQARASALVMVLAPIGYLLFESTIDQRSLDVLLGTTFGRLCLAAGLALDALAVVWIRFLVRAEPEL